MNIFEIFKITTAAWSPYQISILTMTLHHHLKLYNNNNKIYWKKKIVPEQRVSSVLIVDVSQSNVHILIQRIHLLRHKKRKATTTDLDQGQNHNNNSNKKIKLCNNIQIDQTQNLGWDDPSLQCLINHNLLLE